MQKILQATMSSAELLSIPNTTKFTKAVKYIPDDKLWEMCYVLLKIIFPCLRVLCLAGSNISGMDNVYYYYRNTNQCIQKNLILTIREFFLTYCHQPIYGTCLMTKVMKKSQYQMILLCIMKIFFFITSFCNKRE